MTLCLLLSLPSSHCGKGQDSAKTPIEAVPELLSIYCYKSSASGQLNGERPTAHAAYTEQERSPVCYLRTLDLDSRLHLTATLNRINAS